MVKRTSILLVTTLGIPLQVVGCSEPAQELCDQPEDGTDEAGDDGPGIAPEHTEAVPPEESRLLTLNADSAGPTFRNWAEDPRVPVTDEHTLQSYPLRTVVSVALTYRNSAGNLITGRGTGFLAGPRHVITNRHVVQVYEHEINDWLDNPPMFFRLEVFPGRSNVALLNGGAWAVERVIWNPFPETEHNDYAILILKDDSDRSGRYGRLGLCSASKSTLDKLPVVTAGYPASAYKCGQTPDPPDDVNDCPCGGWMYTQTCEVSEVKPQELLYTCKTQKGQSGSPLWVDECISSNTRCTIGIHYGKIGLSSAAVRWRDNDLEWLHSNICQWPSSYAAMPPFCN
jgi:V8-like Glu-specific endopeptidase